MFCKAQQIILCAKDKAKYYLITHKPLLINVLMLRASAVKNFKVLNMAAVLIGEVEAIIDERRLQVVVRVDDLVVHSAVADFQIQCVVRRFVDHMMGVAAADFESGA